MRHQTFSRFPWKILTLGSLVYLVVQALCLGVATISGSSEAREVQVVDVMLREHTWILPLRNGVIPSKPPLFHWLAALVSLAVGGVSELSVRFTSQLAAVGCLFLVALTTYRFAGLTQTVQSPVHRTRAALISFGVLSLTYGFYQMGCQAMVDMTFALCVWGALAGVILGVVDRRENPAAPRREALVHPAAKAAFWASCFVGILARGPLGCFLPVALVGIAGLSVVGLKRTVRELLAPSVGWVALAIPLVWYVAAYQVGGEPFLERQILFENVKRFAGGDFVNSEAWWFYGPSVLRTTFPWGVIAVIILIKELRFSRTISYRNLRVVVRWLPLLLLGVGMVLLSLSSGKRHSYLLPLLPLVAVQLGVEFSTLLDRASTHARSRLYLMGRRLEMWLAGVTLVVATVLSLLHAAQVSVYPGFTEGFQAASPVVVRIAPLLVVCGLVGFLLPHRRLRSLYMSVWCVAIIVMSGVLAAGAVVKGYFKGFDLISATWLQTVGEGEELAVFKHPRDEYFDPILLYVRRPVRLINIEKSPFECRQGTVYAAKRAWLDAHEQLFPSPLVRVVTVHERLRARRESAEREVVLFRCGIGDRGAPGGSPILQDARSEGVVFPRSQEAGIPSA